MKAKEKNINKWRDKAVTNAVIQPSWKERLSILCGAPIRVQLSVYTKIILGEIQTDTQVIIPGLSDNWDDLGFIEHNKKDLV